MCLQAAGLPLHTSAHKQRLEQSSQNRVKQKAKIGDTKVGPDTVKVNLIAWS